MLGASPRTQRSHSSIQLPPEFSQGITQVPLFAYKTSDFVYDLRESTSNDEREEEEEGDQFLEREKEIPKNKKLKDLIHQRWEAGKERGAINYQLNCMYKFLDGNYELCIQLNAERGELRRKPMRFKSIREPFSPLRFNFTKLNEAEVMLYLKCEDRPITNDPLDRHLVAVNASPLTKYHSLIIPTVNKCLPQVLTATGVRVAVDMMLLVVDETFHVLFNSLLGHASVNHLHLHTLYWPYDSDLVNRRFEPLGDIKDAYVIRPPDWFCSAFAFQLLNKDGYEKFMSNLTKCVEFLTERDQAHNVFFTRAQAVRLDGALRVEDRRNERGRYVTAYVFPRSNMHGAKPPTSFSPAACELAGCLTAYTYRFFESVTEQAAVRVIEEEALLPEERFSNLSTDLGCLLAGRPVINRPAAFSQLEGLTSPEIDELHDSFQTFEPHSPARTPRNGRPRTSSADALFMSRLKID
ncbi:unnamed protein product, partial [Mesorhabditis belari]|uniref:GDP-D-glucose phosphorylase 1 n=1 Tax=Mesorhabditis belari TaxID=2138241 RepID=A0AAF3JC89_9BILA